MENNNFTTPAPEDIPIRDPEVAAPEKAEETAAPGKTEVAAAKKPPLKFILIGAAALAVVIAVVVILLSRNSPSSVAKRYVQAFYTDDKTAAHAGIGQRKQRVCRNVQPDMLHAAEAAVASQTCAERRLHSDFFIRSPLCVNFRIFGRAFRDLRAGCAGIAGDKAASGLVQAARSSLVAEHQGFHRDSSCSRLSRMKIIIIF